MLKKLKKKKKTENSINNNVNNPLLEKTPYLFSDYYTYHAGMVSGIFRLFVRPGSNRNVDFIEVLNIIPTEIHDDLKIVFSVNDQVLKDKDKEKLIRENAKKNKNTLQYQAGDDDDATESDINIKIAETKDYNEYEKIIGTSEPIVSYEIKMMVTGENISDIEEFIETQNTMLNQKYDGLAWDNLGGQAKEEFDNFLLYERDPKKKLSSTGANYAMLNFNMSSGLNDEGGVPIGRDALSFFNSTSFFDFNRSTRTQALIAMPKIATMVNYQESDSKPSDHVASIIAQAGANHVSMNGHKVYHLVLNDFDYSKSGIYYRPKQTFEDEIFTKNDVSKLTINPMQGYGDVKDVVNIFARVKNKIVNIFDILLDFKLDMNSKAIILDALNSFYVANKLWNYEAAEKPESTHLVNIKRPETYVTMGRFISSFTSLLTESSNQGRELKVDRVEALKSILEDALTSYMNVLGRPSTIKKSKSLQTYYDFKDIEDSKMKSVQLLNLLEFVIYQAKEGDLIVFHGLDQIDKRVLYMINESISFAIEKLGIKFIYAFDVVSNPVVDGQKKLDMFDLKGAIYRDLDTDVDWSIVGTCLSEEVSMYENALELELSETIRSQMQRASNSMALIHRRIGSINNFTHMNVII